MRRISLVAQYMCAGREDTELVVYDHVKSISWTADNTVLVISIDDNSKSYDIHYPREKIYSFTDELVYLDLVRGVCNDCNGHNCTNERCTKPKCKCEV